MCGKEEQGMDKKHRQHESGKENGGWQLQGEQEREEEGKSIKTHLP